MASKKVLVFVGSVREGRHGLKVANMMLKQLESQGVESSLIGKHKDHFYCLTL
jgi:NAD(P)H-dependent FMN reductase